MSHRLLRAVAVVAAVVSALGAASFAAAPPALAQCVSGPVVGLPLAENAEQEPLISRLGLRRVWEISTGEGVTVAVVDSGVDDRHPKLAGAVAPPTDFTPGLGPAGFTVGPGSSDDCENHGTPIAGLIAGRAAGDDRVVGVAPDAQIVPFRFDGDLTQAPDGMIAAAIRAAADHAQVMNLSFAVPIDYPAIRDAVQYALDRNVVVVAAAGNENESQPGFTWFPAAYDGVLAVAGLDDAGQPMEESNRGAWVDIAAPGENLAAPSAGGQGYVVVNGTSFATGVVSGVVALLRARFPDMPAAEVVRRIEGTAVSLTGGRDERTGAGVVDPFLALTTAGTALPPAEVPQARGGAVRVLPVPTDPDPLGPTGRIAVAVTGIALTAAVVALLAGITARRLAARRGGPAAARYAPAHRPLEPVPHDPLT